MEEDTKVGRDLPGKASSILHLYTIRESTERTGKREDGGGKKDPGKEDEGEGKEEDRRRLLLSRFFANMSFSPPKGVLLFSTC